MHPWEELHPPFGLVLQCGPVEMHPVRMEEIPTLLELISGGIVSPDVPHHPMMVPFALGEDTMERRRASVRFWWSTWTDARPEKWSFPMTVMRAGEIVGVQDISAEDFPALRSATTGSWLGVRHHGRGTGTLMRQAICMFAFDHLEARELHSGAFHDNARSIAVSRGVGYQDNGRELGRRATGEVDEHVLMRLLPHQLRRPEYPLEVTGLEPFKAFIGLEGRASER